MKKLIIISSLFLLCLSGSYAQTISRSVVSSAGGTLTAGSNQVTFSIGETVIPTLAAGGSIITQGFQQPGEQIKTGFIPASICAGTAVSVPYSAIDIGGGNTFTAQLSDASGSFASPVNIGTVTGNASGSISATIPANTVGGFNYRIRVVSDSPEAKGTDNGTGIAISQGLAPDVTGPVNICAYVGTGAPVTYSFNAFGATGYTYTLPPNVSLVSGTSNSITVNFLNGFATQANKQIKVRALSACGTSVQTIYYLVAQAPGTPQPIVASGTNICSIIGTAGTFSYTIPSVAGAASYNWTNPPGTVISHPNGINNPNDTTVTLSFSNSFAGSSLTVSANNGGCGTGGTRSLFIARTNPSTPGLISGPTNACAYISPTGVVATYSVAPVANATSYTWTVPSGAIGLTGQGTNSISFTYPPGFTTGNITVTSTNGCGTSGARSQAITRFNPATPSVIDVIQTQLCPNRVYTYTLASMPANATSIQWTVPAAAISFTGQGTTSIAVTYPPTAVSGNVTAQALNNCGSSITRSSLVKLPACPPEEPLMTKGTGKEILTVDVFGVSIFPNPTTTEFKLRVETKAVETVKIRVLDILGRADKQFTVKPGETTSFGADLKAGTYLIEVRQGNQLKTIKVVKF